MVTSLLFIFLFFNEFFNFLFLSFVKIIDFCWFLFINSCFVMNTFIILRIFPQLFYLFCPIRREVISQQLFLVIFIAFFQKFCHYFGDLWLEYIFAVKVKKIIFFTNMLVKSVWCNLLPKRINYFVLVMMI